MNDKLPVIGISESQAERRLKSGGSAEYLKVRTPYFSEIAPIIIYGAVFLLSTAVIIGSDGWLRTFGVAAAIISAAYTAFYITRADYIGKYKGRNVLIPIFDETDARTARLKNITVTVMRSGEQTKTDITKLVLGDVIMLETGDVVPADCEIVACNSLSTDEVILGGEAVREKKVKFAANAQRSDYTLYAGSIIVSGAATAEIIRVGKNTRYFEKVAAHVEPNSHNTVFWIFLLCAAVFSIVGYVLFQLNFDEYDISATGALFVILSLASFALPFSHTELKRAFNHINGGARFDNGTPQIKTAVIGRTGIITEQPFLDSIYAAVDRYGDKAKTEKFSPMSGIFDDTPTKRASANTPVNKRADSDFTAPFKPPDLAAIAAFRLGHIDDTDEDNDEQTAPLPPNSPETLDVLTLCALSADNSMFGQAVSAAARMVGVRPELAESLYEIPFTPERRVTTVVVRLASHLYVISAGKYEKISEICTSAPPMSADDEYERFTAARCAVTAVAIKEINFLPDNPEPEILERHLIFKGFVAFSSPVRDDAYAHIKKLSEHGVKTILVTGADAETAVNCAKISGIIPDKVTHGTDIDNDTDNDTETDYAAYLLTADDMRELSDDEIKRRVSLSVFAELDSAAKERIMSLEASTTSVLFCGRNLKHNVFGKERGAVAVAPCFASEAVKFIADEVLSDDPLSDIPPLIIEGDAKTRRITLITRLAILKMIPLIAALIILLTPGTDITALIAVGSMQLLIDTALVIAARTRMK